LKPRVGFVVEQALGHVAYGESLLHVLKRRSDLEVEWMPIPFAPDGRMDVPVLRSNWTLRGSIRARQAIIDAEKHRPLDALFIHTQTIALFAGGIAQRVPTLLSLDATPINVDSLALAYEHQVAHPAIERFKRFLLRRVVSKASLYTTWSDWAKQSLVNDYGAPADRVTVIHPGTNLANYPRRTHDSEGGRLRVLFVGGDFPRKGGDVLLQALERDHDELFELHLVTGADVAESERVHVYKGLKPHSPELLGLYASADVFALPTRGDCLAVVLGEAMAAGLPIITTAVGAHAEAVRDGRNGFIVPVGDVDATLQAIRQIAQDRTLRWAMGRQGRTIAEQSFDVEKGANIIGDLLVQLAQSQGRVRTALTPIEPAGRT
jgi:glycosyltransferase involved in cell wall biosynthesis